MKARSGVYIWVPYSTDTPITWFEPIRDLTNNIESMLSLFSFQASEKLELEILDFWLFTELSILEWFSTSFSNMH